MRTTMPNDLLSRLVRTGAGILALSLCAPRAFAQNAISTGTKAGFRMFYPGLNDWWLDPSQGNFDIRMNGKPPSATLSSLGNLGIGTTSPGQKLEVAGHIFINEGAEPELVLSDARASNRFALIDSNSGGSGNYNALMLSSNQTFGGLQGNTSLPSWLVDIGGRDNVTYGNGDTFNISRLPAGSSTYAEMLRITNTGSVGIGVTAPNDLLDLEKDQAADTIVRLDNFNSAGRAVFVAGAYGNVGLYSTGSSYSGTYFGYPASATGLLYFGTGVAAGLMGTSGNAPLIFATNGAERLRIDSSGNVGIGTPAPIDQVTIAGPGTTGLAIRSSTATATLYMQATAGLASAQVAVNNNGGAGVGSFLYDGVGRMGLFVRNSANNANQEALSIVSGQTLAGYVGIGTNNPLFDLHVKDAGTNGVNLFLEGNTVSGKTGDLGLTALTTPAGVRQASFQGQGVASMVIQSETSGNTELIFNSYNPSSGQVERMRLDPFGNLGIGTTAPATKLHLSGGALTVDGSGAGVTVDGRVAVLETGGVSNGTGFGQFMCSANAPGSCTFNIGYGGGGLVEVVEWHSNCTGYYGEKLYLLGNNNTTPVITLVSSVGINECSVTSVGVGTYSWKLTNSASGVGCDAGSCTAYFLKIH